MKYSLFNYRHAEEIVRTKRYKEAFYELDSVITQMPLFVYRMKSRSNKKLDVVQQVCNTYFDRGLAVEHNWKYHPLATKIASSGLMADFRKTFGPKADALTVQAEVQFGNMARWYSDIFKFQAAYSAQMIQIGVCVVPKLSLATRIDSNITNFERVKRELPAAALSITLPILVFGLEPDDKTPVYDLAKCDFHSLSDIVGEKKEDNRYRIVNAFLKGRAAEDVSESSPVGRKAS